jgi:hypothetical protein
MRAALRHALDAAFLAGFRWLMASCALLATGSAIVALVLFRPPPASSPPSPVS